MQTGIGINNLFSKEGYVMASVRVFKVMIERASVRCFLPGVIHPLTSTLYRTRSGPPSTSADVAIIG